MVIGVDTISSLINLSCSLELALVEYSFKVVYLSRALAFGVTGFEYYTAFHSLECIHR